MINYKIILLPKNNPRRLFPPLMIMWECPKCQALFVQKNLSHCCGNYSIEDFLKNTNPGSIKHFRFFIDAWKMIGNVRLHPVKTSISILVDVRFCRVNRVTKTGIVGHRWLKQKITSRKFFKVEKLRSNDYLHHFEIYDEAFIDTEFLNYMKMAYGI